MPQSYMRQLSLTLIVAAALPLAAQNSHDHSAMAHNHATMVMSDTAVVQPQQQPADIIAQVNGLVCDFCARAIEKAIRLDQRITEVEVNLDTSEVKFWLAEGVVYEDDEVAEIIADAGYTLVEIKRGNTPE